ncbi:MAG TPA: hypothetical protein VJT75_01710 [Thermoleophilaceae bacterium]|nr:hypothetical protein [Thermoleophilaceae bacterium]
MTRTAIALVAAAMTVLIAATASSPASTARLHAARYQTTWPISRDVNGGTPNGPSTHAVISGDKRYARMIAFQSDASDLVKGDGNGATDVFVIRREGGYSNDGEPWRAGETRLISKGLHGRDANGASFAPDVDGNFYVAPRCVAFLSKASNLVRNDTNGRTDAFLWRQGDLKRVSYPGGHQAHEDVDSVAVAGDCTRTAFTAGGRLFVRQHGKTKTLFDHGDPRNPSFGAGEHGDLVFDSNGKVYLSREASHDPGVVAHGRNPAFNALRRQVLAYEANRHGHWQIAMRELGGGERVVTQGNGDSRDPVIVNSGYYVGYESEASNLDEAHGLQAYLYTDVRKLNQVRSVDAGGDPLSGGGRDPSVSYYANYILFSSGKAGADQVFMRYLGPK